MKIDSNIKKYDLITLDLGKDQIKNCLIYAVGKDGITIYPIERYIQDAEHPRACAKIYVPYEKIAKTSQESIKLLFYAVNTKHSFLKEALQYHMKNESERR